MTSTLYTYVAFSKLIKACFVHFWGHLVWNLSVEIPEITTSWGSIWWTVQTNASVDYGSLLIWAEMNSSWSTLLVSPIHYMVGWKSFTIFSIYSHSTGWCFLFVLLPVLWMIFNCRSLVIFLWAPLAAMRRTHSRLRSCCVPESDELAAMPTDPHGSVPFSPGWSISVAIIWWCKIGEEHDNEEMWNVLRNIYFATSQNEITNCHVARFTHDMSCCIWLQIAEVSDCSAISH